MVFIQYSMEQIRWLRGISGYYVATSGIVVNLCNSMVFLIGNVSDVEALAKCLNCSAGAVPSKYLGLLLGVPSRFESIWDPVIERFSRKLAGWKRKFLSGVGGLFLSSTIEPPNFSTCRCTIHYSC